MFIWGNAEDKADITARAKEHDREQQEVSDSRAIGDRVCKFGNPSCLLPLHVDDVQVTARRQAVESSFAHFNKLVGQRKADYGCSLRTGIQHEHSPGVVFTHQCVYTGSIILIRAELLFGKDEGTR